MRALVLRLLAPLVLLVVLGACSVDATVTVHLDRDGSGDVSVRVVLDRDAVAGVEVAGGTLDDRVRVDDLREAGWTVGRWRRTAAGGAALTVRKPFDRPEQVAAIVREVNGARGPLRGFAASRDASTFTTTWRARGGVDLRTVDLGVTADPELVAALTAERVDPALVEARLAGRALGALRVTARLELPDAPVRRATATPGKRAAVVTTSDDTAWGRIALLAAGVAAVVAALAILIVGERRLRARRARRPRRIPSRS